MTNTCGDRSPCLPEALRHRVIPVGIHCAGSLGSNRHTPKSVASSSNHDEPFVMLPGRRSQSPVLCRRRRPLLRETATTYPSIEGAEPLSPLGPLTASCLPPDGLPSGKGSDGSPLADDPLPWSIRSAKLVHSAVISPSSGNTLNERATLSISACSIPRSATCCPNSSSAWRSPTGSLPPRWSRSRRATAVWDWTVLTREVRTCGSTDCSR